MNGTNKLNSASAYLHEYTLILSVTSVCMRHCQILHITRVCTYIRECAPQRPLSVLISHQFLLWRTRQPGSKKPSWYQPSRCLDPDSIENASRAVFDTSWWFFL